MTDATYLAQPADAPAQEPGAGGGLENPLEKVTPSLSWLGPEFDQTWIKVVAVIWALAIVVTAVGLITSFLKMRGAKKGGYTDDLNDATGETKKAVIAFSGVIGSPIIVGALIYMFA